MSATTTLPPGPRAPRAVQTLAWAARPMPYMERCRERYGDVFRLRIAQEGTWVFLADPEHVKQVFTGDPGVLHAGEGNRVLRPVLGSNSVLLLDDRPHMAQRKLMLPPFHGERMMAYGELMARVAADEIDAWPVGSPLALWPRMQAVTLEVIMRAVFGVTDPERLARLRVGLRRTGDLVTSAPVLALAAMLGPRRMSSVTRATGATAAVDRVIFEEIALRREAPDLDEREDILSLLLLARHEDGTPMRDVELRDELMTLLVAGHETTATSLAWAIERLVRHPEALARLTDEVAAGEDAYLDAVVKETLRLRPVLPIVARRLTAPFRIGEYELPTGVTLTPCIHLIHRREDVYPEPHRFRPERFLEQPAGTYTWIPFGGGVRRCLGASFALFEMKVVLEQLVSRVQLVPARPEGERVARRAITLTPSRGTEVLVRERRSAQQRAPVAA